MPVDHVQPVKPVLNHSEYSVRTRRQHELDHTTQDYNYPETARRAVEFGNTSDVCVQSRGKLFSFDPYILYYD